MDSTLALPITVVSQQQVPFFTPGTDPKQAGINLSGTL